MIVEEYRKATLNLVNMAETWAGKKFFRSALISAFFNICRFPVGNFKKSLFWV